MLKENEYLDLKEQVNKLERERDEASGAKKQILNALRKEFSVKTLGEAKKLLVHLKMEKLTVEKKFNYEYQKFKKEFRKYQARVKP